MKRYLFVLLLFSSSGFAQFLGEDHCHPIKKRADCEMDVRGYIMRGQNQIIAGLMRDYGLEWFLDYQGVGGRYQLLESAMFFNNPGFFKLIVNNKSYPEAIGDKNKFLMSFMSAPDFREKPAEILDIVFNNKDPKKNLNWFENPAWPYPMLKKFKEDVLKRKDKSKFAGLLARLEKIDQLKTNLCQIKSSEQLEQRITEYPGIDLVFKRDGHKLLECAVKDGNTEFASYLLAQKYFDPQKIAELQTQIEAAPVSKKNLALLAELEKIMNENHLAHPDKEIQENLWVFGRFSKETDCLLNADDAIFQTANTYAEVASKIVEKALLKELEALKEAVSKKDSTKIKTSVSNIQELFEQSGRPVNLQDADGKTLLHHLATFADLNTIEMIERGLNRKQTLDYTIQDKDGNTPLHIAILSKNLKGALAMADNTMDMPHGFRIMDEAIVVKKNQANQTPLDLIRSLKTGSKEDKILKKTIVKWIKEHINPKGRFDEEEDD